MFFVGLSFAAWAAEKPGENVGPGQMTAVKMMEVPKHIQLDRDIVYAVMDGHELKLDIAYPKANKGKTPAIIDIHGGGWVLGDKNPNEAITFAKNGFVGISIQYRLSTVAKFPAAVHDGFEPDPKGSTISPSTEEITAIQMSWFKEVLK